MLCLTLARELGLVVQRAKCLLLPSYWSWVRITPITKLTNNYRLSQFKSGEVRGLSVCCRDDLSVVILIMLALVHSSQTIEATEVTSILQEL
jgi:hypothetical protein